ncbi:amidohydrolase family protein [Asticcacaulis sp. 201]|uniref:amidohydrolase family protein n=1 Tax=Asticcacaulis sp. 201 TaxID=3028787 RepID=UPI002916EC30|nr:amidohydrolase family protein [Asticcacaulis sp. 201]MDV6330843.1 amidohydrolase family protein [Asticcacaulis sp. 201]
MSLSVFVNPSRRLALGIAATSLLALTALSATAQAQVTLQDRRPVLKGIETVDDPRRIPKKPAAEKGRITVLRGGRVFDSVSAATRPATVVIEDNHIRAILPAGAADWPADARIVDVTGETVMPGLIDMHVHLTYPDSDANIDEQGSAVDGAMRGSRNLRWMIESGFTAVRDLNGIGEAPYVLAQWSADNAIPAPRVFTAGHIITGTGGHATERPLTPTHGHDYAIEVDGADAWRGAVRRVFKDGASVIKIASHFAPDEVQAAVDEAHRLGLKVTCDCEGIYTEMAVKAGIDMIEHPLPRTDATIALMAKNHTASVPTLQVYQNVIDRNGGFYGSTSRRFAMTSQDDFDLFKKMKAAGIVMGVGTDTIGDANKMVPNVYLAELKWFVKGGYSLSDTLKAATIVNARLLDMDDKIGSLEAGKLADILVVRGNPDQSLEDLQKVDLVFKDGILFVENGQVVTPRHVAQPLLKPSPPESTK